MSDTPPGKASTIILIVEDEPLLMMMAVDLVEDAGYGAVVAQNADEAVRILLSRTDIRIVFTDIDMPGTMDGLKLAATIRDRWPPIDIIITSGYRKPAVTELPVRAIFFAKPYVPSQVQRAMRQMAA